MRVETVEITTVGEGEHARQVSRNLSAQEIDDKINEKIKAQLIQDRQNEFKLNPIYEQMQQVKETGGKADKNQPEVEKLKTPMEVGKEQDDKRLFLNEFRSCGLNKAKMHYWNFVETENVTPHVLRSNARPELSYCDKRCEELMALIEHMSKMLVSFNKENWDRLNKETHEIFTKTHAEMEEKLKAKSEQQQQ
jgi:short subunit dehydrogenase-like uncharacterized protein